MGSSTFGLSCVPITKAQIFISVLHQKQVKKCFPKCSRVSALPTTLIHIAYRPRKIFILQSCPDITVMIILALATSFPPVYWIDCFPVLTFRTSPSSGVCRKGRRVLMCFCPLSASAEQWCWPQLIAWWCGGQRCGGVCKKGCTRWPMPHHMGMWSVDWTASWPPWPPSHPLSVLNSWTTSTGPLC